MRFCGNDRRVRFVAQSSKYPRYVFDCAPRGHRRAFSAKIFDRRGGRFFVFSRRQDAEIPGYFKDDNAVKRKISPSAAHCTLIVLSKQTRLKHPKALLYIFRFLNEKNVWGRAGAFGTERRLSVPRRGGGWGWRAAAAGRPRPLKRRRLFALKKRRKPACALYAQAPGRQNRSGAPPALCFR